MKKNSIYATLAGSLLLAAGYAPLFCASINPHDISFSQMILEGDQKKLIDLIQQKSDTALKEINALFDSYNSQQWMQKLLQATDSDGNITITTAIASTPAIFDRIVQEFKDAGLSVDTENPNGTTALRIAIEHQNNPEIVIKLLAAGANINQQTKNSGATPLMVALQKDAITHNKGPIIDALLAHQPLLDITIKNKSNATALAYAAQNDDIKLVRTLLERGAIIDQKTLNNAGPKAKKFLIDWQQKMLAPRPQEAVSTSSTSTTIPSVVPAKPTQADIDAFVNAAGKKGDSLTEIEALLNNKTDSWKKELLEGRTKSSPQLTALIAAIAYNNKAIAKYLLTLGKTLNAYNQINIKTSQGQTPLNIAAVINDNAEMVRLLLENNAPVDEVVFKNAKPKSRQVILEWQAVHRAVTPQKTTHSFASTIMLNDIDEFVDLVRKDTPSETLAAKAKQRIITKEQFLDELNKEKIAAIRTFLQDINNNDIPALLAGISRETGNTALNEAVLADNIPMVNFLLRLDTTTINTINRNRDTALNIAAKNHSNKIAKLLLAAGANPEIPDRAGWTPLISAIQTGNIELAYMLLKHYYAIVNTRDKNGNTALILAARDGNLDLVKLLIAHRADQSLTNNDRQRAIDVARGDVKTYLESLGSASSSTSTSTTTTHYTVNQPTQSEDKEADNKARAKQEAEDRQQRNLTAQEYNAFLQPQPVTNEPETKAHSAATTAAKK